MKLRNISFKKESKSRIKSLNQSYSKKGKTQAKSKSLCLFTQILQKSLPSIQDREGRFNRFQKLNCHFPKRNLSKSLQKLSHFMKKVPRNNKKNGVKTNHLLFRKMKIFYDIETLTKPDSNKFDQMKLTEINQIFCAQSMFRIPLSTLKIYFGNINTAYSEHKKQDKTKLSKLIQSEIDSITKNFQSIQLTKKRIRNEVHLNKKFEYFKQQDLNQKSDIKYLQDFGIDIALREELFGDKINERHLKTRRSRHCQDKVEIMSPVFSKVSKKQLRKDLSVNSYQNDPKQGNNKSSKFDQNFYIKKLAKPSKDKNRLLKSVFLNNIKQNLPHKSTQQSNLKPQSYSEPYTKTSTNQNKIIVNSRKCSKDDIEQDSLMKSKVLYSFRDDLTIANQTDKEDYEIVKVNSKSIFDLSQANWSQSNMTKTHSYGTIVSLICRLIKEFQE